MVFAVFPPVCVVLRFLDHETKHPARDAKRKQKSTQQLLEHGPREVFAGALVTEVSLVNARLFLGQPHKEQNYGDRRLFG